MSAIDKVVIDEMRWPGMFGSMRRAGMYQHCGCTGCPPCMNAARRLVRGVARNAQWSAPYRPEQWGNRYRLLSRTIGPRVVNVLTDVSSAPTVVDVSISDPDASDAMNIENLLGDEISVGRLLSGHPASKVNLGAGGPLGRKFSLPIEVSDIAAGRRLHEIPSSSGVYLIQWPDGQYLGRAFNLQHRIRTHAQCINRFARNPGAYKVSFALTAGPIGAEKRILKTVIERVGNQPRRIADRFAKAGMTNKQQEADFS